MVCSVAVTKASSRGGRRPGMGRGCNAVTVRSVAAAKLAPFVAVAACPRRWHEGDQTAGGIGSNFFWEVRACTTGLFTLSLMENLQNAPVSTERQHPRRLTRRRGRPVLRGGKDAPAGAVHLVFPGQRRGWILRAVRERGSPTPNPPPVSLVSSPNRASPSFTCQRPRALLLEKLTSDRFGKPKKASPPSLGHGGGSAALPRPLPLCFTVFKYRQKDTGGREVSFPFVFSGDMGGGNVPDH